MIEVNRFPPRKKNEDASSAAAHFEQAHSVATQMERSLGGTQGNKEGEILDALPAQIALLDAAGTIRYVNRAWQNYAERNGATAAGVGLGGNYLKQGISAWTLQEEDAQTVVAGIARVVEGDQSGFALDFQAKTDDGPRWLKIVCVPMPRREDGIVILQVDATDRVLAEEAAQAGEQQFRTLIEYGTDIISIHVKDGTMVYQSPSVRSVLGYEPEELLTKNIFEYLAPESIEPVQAAYRAMLDAPGKLVHVEAWLRAKNGGYQCFDCTGRNLLDDPLVLGILFNARDITERKRVAQELEEKAQLLELATDGIFICDAQGVITSWNRGAERIYGWTAAEAIGRRAAELLNGNNREREEVLAGLKCKGYWTAEVDHKSRSGARLRILSRCSCLRDDAGRLKSILTINSDITEQRTMEEHYFRAQRMESIGLLAGGVAHDLNNIFTPLLLSLELLQEDISDTNRDLIETMEVSATRGSQMVKQLLTFARGVDGERLRVDAGGLVAEVQKVARDSFPKNIVLRVDVPTDVWPTIGDPTQLHQVLLNLVVNARDAMPEGGSLTITLSNVVIDEQYASSDPEARIGNYVLFRITDTGEGIAREVLTHIFEPFFTTKEATKGTGLGLTTSLAITRSHGGFLKVESQQGLGSSFSLYLPADHRDAPAQASTASPILNGNGEVILLVDDDDGVRLVTRRTLERHNYKVLLAVDGADGVAVFAQHSHEISLVVADVVMPVLNGPQMIGAIRRINPDVKVMATSGFADKGASAAIQDLGLPVFLRKPYSAEILLRSIGNLLAN